jgi:hypothetical protein
LTINLRGNSLDRTSRVARNRHSSKDIEEALRHAERAGWRVEVGGSHAWGRIFCPYDDSACRCGEFCITSIWSTPKNPGNFARKIKRVVDNCTARRKRTAHDEPQSG